MDLKTKSFKILEFDKILDKLASFTESELVKNRIRDLKPAEDLQEAKRRQKETTEAQATTLKLGGPPVNLSLNDVTASVKRAEQGGGLNYGELLSVARTLYVARRMKSYLAEASSECYILHNIGDNLLTLKSFEDKINRSIISDEEMADDASGELSAIRRKIKNLNTKIRDNLNDLVRSSHYKKFLQDSVVTMRGDRFVIPVRSEYRAEIPGIIHDTSSSGATLFIEPMAVLNSNNEIRDLKNKEQIEIDRILAELSAEVSENSHTVFVDYNNITELDFLFCKAKLSLDMNANEPELNDKGIVELKKARHPLIDKDKVVANDIYIGEKFDSLVITGPNTGGKTVTLKTIGLFSLMAGAGLHIPASDGSQAALFTGVYADIGDEQSIEQSLSTFSSHMVNIVNILESIEPGNLVLFDELGGGTDPTEGAALAISIIEYLRARGIRTVSTTHYSELKLFALSTDGVENASCEFDVDTLSPTYKLLIGVPGKSNAFAISRRLGLNESVIDRANQILSDEDIKFEDVLTDLEHNRRKAQEDREQVERMRREIQELRKTVEADRIKLKENKSRVMEEARREAKLIVMDAREEANRVIRELEKLKKETKSDKLSEKTQKAREALKEKEESIDKKMQKAKSVKRIYTEPPKNLKLGETVKIVDMNELATIIKEPDKNGMVKVQAGIIKFDVHITNLKRVEDKTSKELAEKYVKSTRVFESKTKNATTELDIRGENVEEAYMSVGKFIDDCYLANISPVSIIHGKGTGVLRKGVHEILRRHKYVKDFRLGRYGEGETGVTIVELK